MSPTSGTLISISDMELVSSADSALRTKDARALIEIGGELERRGIFHLAWRCLGEGSRIRKPATAAALDWARLFRKSASLKAAHAPSRSGAKKCPLY